MAGQPLPRDSLRYRLLALGGTTIFLCVCVMLLFIPLLHITLHGLMDRTIQSIYEEKEVEATTIARLTVMEFSHLKALPTVEAGVERPIDQVINHLLWEKVTFNEIIQGIELIHASRDSEGRYLTYWYYRRDDPELKPMFGPKKELKRFSGLEGELIDIINNQQRVDETLLESVNRAPKVEGDMLLRYFPLYVPETDLGAVYWGVAKIGVDADSLRRLLLLQSQEQRHLRNAIWLEISLSLLIPSLLALGMVFLGVKYLTEPLTRLNEMSHAMQAEQAPELDLWLDNLQRINLKGQEEVTCLRQVIVRLAQAIQKTGRQLIAAERQACWGQLTERIISPLKAQTEALQELQARLQESFQTLVNLVKVYESLPSLTEMQKAEMRQVRQQLETHGVPISPRCGHQLAAGLKNLEIKLNNLGRFLLPSESEWKYVDLIPGLNSAVDLISSSLPAGVKFIQDLGVLPPVWGCQVDLEQAFLYLLQYAVQGLRKGGELAIQTRQSSPEWIEFSLGFSGVPHSKAEIQALLTPFQAVGELPLSLGPALAAAIFRQHGGKLTVQPREEGGLTFLVELPTAQVRDESHDPVI